MKIDTELEVKKIVAEVGECEIEEVDLDANIYSELGIDSLKAIEISVMVEKKFKIAIRGEQIASIITARNILNLVKKALKNKGKKKK